MFERVDAIDVGVVWDPNAPRAVLISDDSGRTALALSPRSDDSDQRAVVLMWSESIYNVMGIPNDEAVSGHRLYGKGLENVPWIGRVSGSQLVEMIEKQNSVHPQHDVRRFEGLVHHVVLTKESVVEVVAGGLTVRRIDGSPHRAAVEALLEA